MNNSKIFPMYFDVPWVCRYAIPILFFIFWCLGSIALWMANEESLISTQPLKIYGATNALIIVISATFSYMAPAVVRRVRHFYLLCGLATISSLTSCTVIAAIYFIAKPAQYGALVLLGVVTLWLTQVYLDAIRRVRIKKIIEKNYIEQADCFILKKPINEFNGDVHLTLKQHAEKNWIYIFIVCWSSYEFFTTDFKASLPLDLFKYWILNGFALICGVYAAARLIQGFYLWFYVIWKLERQTGKKFLFPVPEGNTHGEGSRTAPE
ncbi:hypothetical protein [Limnobacter sp.]|uniref:hypothetical protein n=1 Tax=Limnobacter sp. TaxID=2003368 RepID=UPI002FE106A7